MSRAAPAVPRIEARGDLAVNAASWARHLRASNLSPNTTRTYLDSVGRLAAFLDERGMPADLATIRREHVEAFIEHLLERWRPATAANRFVALKVFFAWAAEEGEIRESPMARMRKPRIPEEQPDVLTPGQLRAILAACEGRTSSSGATWRSCARSSGRAHVSPDAPTSGGRPMTP